MKATTRAYWKLISEQCNLLSSGKDAMYIDESLKDEYIAKCDETYKQFKVSQMSRDVVNLDRHKVAAILLKEALDLKIIKRKDGKNADTSKQLFIGPQKILLICVISYLAQEINGILKMQGNDMLPMGQFKMPVPFSCTTSYIDILSRLLRNEEDANKLYILSLSEKFFLLEYIAIQSYYGDAAEQVFQILRKPVR